MQNGTVPLGRMHIYMIHGNYTVHLWKFATKVDGKAEDEEVNEKGICGCVGQSFFNLLLLVYACQRIKLKSTLRFKLGFVCVFRACLCFGIK